MFQKPHNVKCVYLCDKEVNCLHKSIRLVSLFSFIALITQVVCEEVLHYFAGLTAPISELDFCARPKPHLGACSQAFRMRDSSILSEKYASKSV